MSAVTLYDPRGLSFVQWASLLVEMFADQNLEYPTDNTDWKMWAYGLSGNGYFTQYNIPTPDGFNNWEDWAMRVVQSNPVPGDA